MKTYKILDLIPQELKIKTRTLEYYAEKYRKHGRIYLPDPPPMVDKVRSTLYLADGNQRAIFYLLNGINTIKANERILDPDDEDVEVCEIIAEKNRRCGINSFQDLAAKVKNAERFIVRPEMM